MFKWLIKMKAKDLQADELIAKSHQINMATVERAKIRSEKTAKQADKQLQKVYDVAEKVYLATGQQK